MRDFIPHLSKFLNTFSLIHPGRLSHSLLPTVLLLLEYALMFIIYPSNASICFAAMYFFPILPSQICNLNFVTCLSWILAQFCWKNLSARSFWKTFTCQSSNLLSCPSFESLSLMGFLEEARLKQQQIIAQAIWLLSFSIWSLPNELGVIFPAQGCIYISADKVYQEECSSHWEWQTPPRVFVPFTPYEFRFLVPTISFYYFFSFSIMEPF